MSTEADENVIAVLLDRVNADTFAALRDFASNYSWRGLPTPKDPELEADLIIGSLADGAAMTYDDFRGWVDQRSVNYLRQRLIMAAKKEMARQRNARWP